MFDANNTLVKRYFDHGATSFPKPKDVADAMVRYTNEIGGTYGRGAYSQSHAASALVYDTRDKMAQLLGAPDSSRIAFTLNATHALNMAICGMAKPNTTILISPLEHNSVLRPLFLLQKKHNINVKFLPHSSDGRIISDEIKIDKKVSLVIVSMQSNVNGVIQPVAQIKKRLNNIPLLVDAAQAVGEISVNVVRDNIDLLAVPGHKHLLGPTGTGALYVKKSITLPPLIAGGTGSRSESTQHPEIMPDSLEGGTPNIVGLAGLGASLDFLLKNGIKSNQYLAQKTIDALKSNKKITIYKALNPVHQGSLFSFTIKGMSSSDVAYKLFKTSNIAVRAGLHCSPDAHKTIKTFDNGGTVRLSFGRFHDESCVDFLINSILKISEK